MAFWKQCRSTSALASTKFYQLYRLIRTYTVQKSLHVTFLLHCLICRYNEINTKTLWFECVACKNTYRKRPIAMGTEAGSNGNVINRMWIGIVPCHELGFPDIISGSYPNIVIGPGYPKWSLICAANRVTSEQKVNRHDIYWGTSP